MENKMMSLYLYRFTRNYSCFPSLKVRELIVSVTEFSVPQLQSRGVLDLFLVFFVQFCFLFVFIYILGIEVRASHMLNKGSDSEPHTHTHTQLLNSFFVLFLTFKN